MCSSLVSIVYGVFADFFCQVDWQRLIADVQRAAGKSTGKKEKSEEAAPAEFLMAETEMAFAVWSEVYVRETRTQAGEKTKRASDGGQVYYIPNPGTRGVFSNGTYGEYLNGREGHPVTNVTWRDAIVWCNAFTEYCNTIRGTSREPEFVYQYKDSVIRDSRDSNEAECDNAAAKKLQADFVCLQLSNGNMPPAIMEHLRSMLCRADECILPRVELCVRRFRRVYQYRSDIDSSSIW
jgi:hypothetical protein